MTNGVLETERGALRMGSGKQRPLRTGVNIIAAVIVVEGESVRCLESPQSRYQICCYLKRIQFSIEILNCYTRSKCFYGSEPVDRMFMHCFVRYSSSSRVQSPPCCAPVRS